MFILILGIGSLGGQIKVPLFNSVLHQRLGKVVYNLSERNDFVGKKLKQRPIVAKGYTFNG